MFYYNCYFILFLCRVITSKVSLDEAEYLNLGATISMINKKLVNTQTKIEYFKELLKKNSREMEKDMKRSLQNMYNHVVLG